MLRARVGVWRSMILFGRASPRQTSAGFGARLRQRRGRVNTGALPPCCMSRKARPSARARAAFTRHVPASNGGSRVMSAGAVSTTLRTGGARGDRAWPDASRSSGSQRSCAVIRECSCIKPRRGRSRCSRAIAVSTAEWSSARARCAAGCARRASGGSARAIATVNARRIWRRKGGSPASPESGSRPARRHALHGLDVVATLSATARRVGTGRVGRHGGDHRRECQGGAVRRDQRADRASRGPGAREGGRSRCARLSARAAAHYRRPHTIWLLADRATAHTDRQTQALAAQLHIQFVWLPKQAPELNAMDQLWRELKRVVAANRQAPNIAALATSAMLWVLMLSTTEARRKAGLLSRHYWLHDL